MIPDELPAAVLAAPVGAALVNELRRRADRMLSHELNDRSEDGRDAQDLVGVVVDRGFDYLCELISVASEEIGPWWPGADSRREELLLKAVGGEQIVSILLEAFLESLSSALDPATQEHWTFGDTGRPALRCSDHSTVYGDGQFSFGGIWTASTGGSSPSPAQLAAWDLDETARRWRVRVTRDPRVVEIASMDDWVALSKGHPKVGFPTAPDWSVVAGHFDVVHLTWIGYVLAHDNTAAAEQNDVVPLRYWGSERSLWLTDCLELL